MQARHEIIALYAVMTSCSYSASEASQNSVEACEIALHYAQHFTEKVENFEPFEERRLAVISRREGLVPTQEDLDLYTAQNPPVYDPGEFELVRIAINADDVSVLDECENVRKWAARNDVLLDENKIDELTREEKWSIVLLNLTMPAVSKNSSKAIIYVSEYAGGLAGSLWIHDLREGA